MSSPPPLEARIIEALQPLRQHAVAACIHHLFESKLFERLHQARTLTELAGDEFDPAKLHAFLRFLRNEAFVDEVSGRWELSDKGHELELVRGWYTMFVGGYGSTFLQLGDKLKTGSGWATREAGMVGIGANLISRLDTIPLTRDIATRLQPQRIVDLGCGSGLYLIELCKALPSAHAWGVEPARGGFERAQALVRENELTERVRLTNASAIDFVRDASTQYEADFGIIAFVLQELLGQDGEQAVESFLKDIFEKFPGLRLLVLEIDVQLDNPAVMRHGLSQAFYNPYYLLHPFTEQRLESAAFWEALFARCGLEILSRQSVDASVDSTGLVLAYVLTAAR